MYFSDRYISDPRQNLRPANYIRCIKNFVSLMSEDYSYIYIYIYIYICSEAVILIRIFSRETPPS